MADIFDNSWATKSGAVRAAKAAGFAIGTYKAEMDFGGRWILENHGAHSSTDGYSEWAREREEWDAFWAEHTARR